MFCRKSLQEGDQLSPPQVVSYGGRDVQLAFIRSFVQVFLLQPDTPALSCFHLSNCMMCLCSS